MMNRLVLTLAAAAALVAAQTGGPAAFDTPEQARDALIDATGKGLDAVRTLFGPGSAEILRTGDEVEDKNGLERFKQRAAAKFQFVPDPMNPDRLNMEVGSEEWPLAIPLIRRSGKWRFDIQQGKAEIRNRTIGRHELDAIEICRGYVEAQERYAEKDWDNNGVLEYAKKILSSEGKRDGLHWPGEDSPVAASLAKAAAEGYRYGSSGGAPKPYHGYFYKVLTSQGPDARGGAQDYIIKGLMIAGFALIAWPAEYGVSGIKTFVVNHDGVVYEKDLGPTTGRVAPTITRYNPDKTWQESPEETLPLP
jgi:hypothetical protein